MKKSIVLILAFALVLTALFAFCSCGNDSDKENNDEKATAYVDGNDNVIDDHFDIDTEAAE